MNHRQTAITTNPGVAVSVRARRDRVDRADSLITGTNRDAARSEVPTSRDVPPVEPLLAKESQHMKSLLGAVPAIGPASGR